ncbi:RHS repeat-associated core domain-containing protein [Bradyrhizobium sp. SZCCHNR2011]|uniref:RHS repeat-associated core domain-containing protein n=1 Tax=Bradyrhizobium sp. SZCCHNR2011 TaxID=3057376 RepID=UPI0028F0372D|nr:RHS repeat-associated core domain-containing protein [Bradyrhizobium sp. SZCCHNR2011]
MLNVQTRMSRFGLFSKLNGLAIVLLVSAAVPSTARATQIFLTNGSSWTVPDDWNSASNTVEVIGGGGGGGGGSSSSVDEGAGGGGGGAYSKITNLPLLPGSVVTYQIGAGGSGGSVGSVGGAGGDSYFNGSGANCSAQSVCAKGGAGGTISSGYAAASGGTGGAAAGGLGTVRYSGGAGGGSGSTSNGGGGGGGAAGPNGNGGGGGTTGQNGSGAGGGGNGGGSNGAGGGAGGNNSAGTGGGAPGSAGIPGSNGIAGGGGGAGYWNGSAWVNNAGGSGGAGTEWDATHGSGGGAASGAGGGGTTVGANGAAGLYGGGGAGRSGLGSGGSAGAQGIIVVTYTTSQTSTPPGDGSGVSSITQTSSYAYDASTGLVIQHVVEPDAPAFRLQTDYTYDNFGNVLTSTVSGIDVVTRSSASNYDARGQFAVTNTNALGHSESFQYDPRSGLPTSRTEPNGLTTSWQYDGMGRKILEIRPDGTQTRWAYRFCGGVNGGTAGCPTGGIYRTEETSYAADGATVNAPYEIIYYGLLDREIARDSQGFDGSTIRATTSYDALGRPAQVSLPYFLNGTTPRYTTFTYDVLGRPLTRTEPDGGVSQVAYRGLTITQTDALGHTRAVTQDSRGNVLSVTDALGLTMRFAYDAVGNLVRTTDPVGNMASANYDLRGNRIATSDPDVGNWSYSYNALGLLVSQTDAKGQTANQTYDRLNRLVQTMEPDMTSVWTYDTAAHGIGKLASTSITGGPANGFSRTSSYDALGRPVQVATTIDGTTYTFGASYDVNGRLKTVSYPSGFTARRNYTGLGDANQLLDDTTGYPYWTANSADAELRVTQDTAGNGLTTVRSFDALTGRLTGISTGLSGVVHNFSYTYDRGGNPLSRTDANNNLSETFIYDALNRLTSATVNLTPTPLSKTFTYDSTGNLLAKSDIGTYSYPASGSAKPHAVMSVTGGPISTAFTYDANGNQTSGLGRSLVYTSYDKPSSITQGSRTISFLYDSDHQRFKQITPEATVLYVSAFGVMAEVSNPGTASMRWTDYLSVGGSIIGARFSQPATETLSTRYFHADALGSIAVITSETGVIQERLSYDAWGKRRSPNGADDPAGSITSQTSRGFAGEEQLSVGGLVHLNGRVYDPSLARMTSADPTVPRPLSSQGWNRYTYAGNTPLRRVDPSGYSDCEAVETVNMPACPGNSSQSATELPPVTIDPPKPRAPAAPTVSYCWGCSTGAGSSAPTSLGPVVIDLLAGMGGGNGRLELPAPVAPAVGFTTGFSAGFKHALFGHENYPLSSRLQGGDTLFKTGAFFGLEAGAFVGMLPFLVTKGAPTAPKVGAGGSWATIGATEGGAVAQLTSTSCVAACGEMLSNISQAALMRAIGAPASSKALAGALGAGWRGGYVGPEALRALLARGPFAAELYEGGKLSHMVVVDGMKAGHVLIRDPWGAGSAYRMTIQEFQRVWNGNVVFRSVVNR